MCDVVLPWGGGQRTASRQRAAQSLTMNSFGDSSFGENSFVPWVGAFDEATLSRRWAGLHPTSTTMVSKKGAVHWATLGDTRGAVRHVAECKGAADTATLALPGAASSSMNSLGTRGTKCGAPTLAGGGSRTSHHSDSAGVHRKAWRYLAELRGVNPPERRAVGAMYGYGDRGQPVIRPH